MKAGKSRPSSIHLHLSDDWQLCGSDLRLAARVALPSRLDQTATQDARGRSARDILFTTGRDEPFSITSGSFSANRVNSEQAHSIYAKKPDRRAAAHRNLRLETIRNEDWIGPRSGSSNDLRFRKHHEGKSWGPVSRPGFGLLPEPITSEEIDSSGRFI